MAKKTKKSLRQKKSTKKKTRKLTKMLLKLAFASLSVVVISLLYVYLQLPEINTILNHDHSPVITIKSDNGVVLARYGNIHGVKLKYFQIPKYLIEAVVSTEDKRFFKHHGIDPLGLIRAIYINHKAGKIIQGGSTITQQLAKISLLTPEKTIYRKLQDALLAFEIEKNFSKKEIIAMYLNKVYLGRGNYGVDAASKFYFGKNIQNINLYEAAILAGMLKSPNRLAPTNNKEACFKRAQQVLYNMKHDGYITEFELHNLPPPKIIERGEGRGALSNPYFADYVMETLPELIGSMEQSMTVYTTLNLKMQKQLEKSVLDTISTQNSKTPIQAAAVTINNSGLIKAWVGGTSYKKSQFDRVNKAKRQPGSSFKLFVYLAALENGIKLNDYFIDRPISIGKWKPRNFNRKYEGEITIKDAFAKSINTIAAQLANKVGIQKVINVAYNLGVTEALPNLPSISLGTAEIPLLQMTSAYAGLASKGHRITPVSILKVVDYNGNLLYKSSSTLGPKVISSKVVKDMLILLNESVKNGTSKRAFIPHLKMYGKTGTSQDHRDAWFFGFTDKLTTGIWVGNDNNKSMGYITGGVLPATIWKNYMLKIEEEKNPLQKSDNNLFDWLFSSPKRADTIDRVISKNRS